jgi:hypothetical protein
MASSSSGAAYTSSSGMESVTANSEAPATVLQAWDRILDYIALQGSKGCTLSRAFEAVGIPAEKGALQGYLSMQMKQKLPIEWSVQGAADNRLNSAEITITAPVHESLKAYGFHIPQELTPQMMTALEMLGAARDKGCLVTDISKQLKMSKIHHIVDKLALLGVVTKRAVRMDKRSKQQQHFQRHVILHLKRFASDFDPQKYNFAFEIGKNSKMVLIALIREKLHELSSEGVKSIRIADIASLMELSTRDMMEIREFVESPQFKYSAKGLNFFQGNDEETRARCWFISLPDTSDMCVADNSTSPFKTEFGNDSDEDEEDEPEAGQEFGSCCLQNAGLYEQTHLIVNHSQSGTSSSGLQRSLGLPKKKAARKFSEMISIFKYTTKKVQRGRNAVCLLQSRVPHIVDLSDGPKNSEHGISETRGLPCGAAVADTAAVLGTSAKAQLTVEDLREARQNIILDAVAKVNGFITANVGIYYETLTCCVGWWGGSVFGGPRRYKEA